MIALYNGVCKAVRKIGVICGLKLEADCLSGIIPAEKIRIAAGKAERAQSMAQDLIDQGAELLVSFGLAGGLDPDLVPGSLILADQVIDRHGNGYATSIDINQSLSSHNDSWTTGALIGHNQPAIYNEAKLALHYIYDDALAVDMESHGVARAAKDAALPFIVIRAISDSAAMALPNAALSGMGEKGESRIWPVIASLIKRPHELYALMRLAGDVEKAKKSLKQAAKLLPEI